MASWLGGCPGCGDGRAVTMTVKAVFGMEVSMDCDVVKLVNFSTRGHRDSNDMRTASGLRLFPSGRLATFGHIRQIAMF